MTGATFMGTELSSKGLGLLRELVPNAKVIAVLVNPDNSMRNLEYGKSKTWPASSACKFTYCVHAAMSNSMPSSQAL